MKYDHSRGDRIYNAIRKRREQEEKDGEKRKKEVFINLIRSEEQKHLDMLHLDLNMDKLNYTALKYFLVYDRYYEAERLMNTMAYYKYLDKTRTTKRLNPSGQFDGIMFLGVNPSQRSLLENVWDDPFGKYFGKMLEEADIDPKKVWMTNLYKKPTEGNRALNDREIKEGIRELKLEIEMVNPKIIVALGRQPAKVLEENFPFVNWIFMYHPAYIIRNNSPDQRSKYILSLKQLKKNE